jgi:hypothetical protein
MNIISVTDEGTGEKIFINANYIIRFRSNANGTRVELQNATGGFYIKESAEWLFERLNNIA